MVGGVLNFAPAPADDSSTRQPATESDTYERVDTALTDHTSLSSGATRSMQRSVSSPTHATRRKRERIVVPFCSSSGGSNINFDPDPQKVDRCDLMGSEEYEDAINVLNDILRPSRSTKLDKFLLAMSPLIVPLAIYCRRKSRRSKERKILLHEGIIQFNEAYPALRMKWNRTSAGDFLSIKPRTTSDAGTMLTGLEHVIR